MDKEDLDAIKKVFDLLAKAKWDNVDGDFMVGAYYAFSKFRKLEEKIEKSFNKPEIKEAEKTNIKKPRKIKKDVISE